VPHRRNRVTPFGDIIATPERGLLFGNRGVLHDEHGRLVRDWQVRRWLACRLAFRGRWRPPMQPGRYAGLFFLDEVTALAAGHRPCAECRREDYERFRGAWMHAHPDTPARADDMDRALHGERLDGAGRKRTHAMPPAGVPDGAMIALDDRPWLVIGETLLAWSLAGYTERIAASTAATVAVLTPPSTLAVIRGGYSPALHPSAARYGAMSVRSGGNSATSPSAST
jgi:hypothetical protein